MLFDKIKLGAYGKPDLLAYPKLVISILVFTFRLANRPLFVKPGK